MENTQHNNLLLLHGIGASSFRSARGLIIPRLVGLLWILWKRNGGHQSAKHLARETGGPHTCDSGLRTNHALKAATEDVRSGWFRSRPRTFLICATSVNGPIGACGWMSGGSDVAKGGAPCGGGGGGTARQRRIGLPLRVVVERLLGWTVDMRGRVLWWRGGGGGVWVVVPAHPRLPIPSGSLHNG